MIKHVRNALNQSNIPFAIIIDTLKKYFLTEEVRNNALNHVILSAMKAKNFTTIDLMRWFVLDNMHVVKGTRLCQTDYNAQMLLKSVWEQCRFSDVVINMIKNKQVFLIQSEVDKIVKAYVDSVKPATIPKETEFVHVPYIVNLDKPEKPVENPPKQQPTKATEPPVKIGETDMTPGQLRAKRMREAKARKRIEREKAEQKAKQLEQSTKSKDELEAERLNKQQLLKFPKK